MSDKLSRRTLLGSITSVGGLAAIAGCSETDEISDGVIGGVIGGSGTSPLEIASNETVTIESDNSKFYNGIRWESGGVLAWESGGKLRLEATTEESQ